MRHVLHCPHAVGTHLFSAEWAEPFRYVLLLSASHSTASLRSVAQGRLRLLSNDESRRWWLSLKMAAVCIREIPRPAGENAGLRDDAGFGEGAAQFQASRLWARGHAGACSVAAQRAARGSVQKCPTQAKKRLEWATRRLEWGTRPVPWFRPQLERHLPKRRPANAESTNPPE